jgi:RNA polymerase sigma-70 factor (ECF subfamily)
MEITSSEREAVSLARNGDASAYAVLVQSHQEAAFRAAFLILRDAQAAEDVTQEAFIRAYQHLDRFRDEAAFRPWLLRIVTNLALNQVRSHGRRLSLLQRLGGRAEETEPPADAAIAATEEARTLWRAINRLDLDDRLVLYLRYFLEQSEDDMARVIGKAPGTVKSRLHRAGRRLRDVIERDFPQLRLDS